MIVDILKSLASVYLTVFVIICIMYVILFIPILMLAGGMKDSEEKSIYLQGPFALTNFLISYPFIYPAKTFNGIKYIGKNMVKTIGVDYIYS
jgi:hypothetical protein